MTPEVSSAGDEAPAPRPAAAAFGRAAAIAQILLLAACAQVPTDPEARAAYDRANDPAEPTNRVIFDGNQWVDRNALQPVARAYEEYVPGRVRKSLRNFTINLREPAILVNDALQANFDRAWNTTQRFVVNSTVGGAGLFDVATDWDLPYHEADFGQTFGVWGVGPGPSVQLPLLGQSNVRDTAGKAAGFFANPLSFIQGGTMQAIEISATAVSVVDQRARMLPVTDELEKSSLDYYATTRSLYAQRRAALVEEGKAGGATARQDVGPGAPLPDGTPTPAVP